MDLSRLSWKDVPLIARATNTDGPVSFDIELRGGLSHPTWGDDGPVLNLQYCHFVMDGDARQIQSFNIPASMLAALHDVAGKALRDLAVDGQEPTI